MQLQVHRFSVQSLMLRLLANGNYLSLATGFVVEREGRFFLITNYHVLAGRHPDTGRALDSALALPDTVHITHHSSHRLGSWSYVTEPLLDAEGLPLFYTHPKNSPGSVIDVVALPLTDLPDSVKHEPAEMSKTKPALTPADMAIWPSTSVSVVGFPEGLRSAGYFPVWKTGHIASDPDLDHGNLPSFLIDATTRSGMSGSPVYLISMGGYPLRDGGGIVLGSAEAFLGVYASRVVPALEAIEIGRVWKPQVIDEIIAHAHQATTFA